MGDVAKIICVGGSFEINISLGLTEKQYSFLNINYDKIKDLSELKPYFNNNENFNKDDSNHNFSVLSLLSISSTNSLFNNLLFINRANKVKSFIEYIIPFLPKYELEYEFMENIVKIICEKNYIFIEYYNLLDIKPNITFSMKMDKLLMQKILFYQKKTNFQKQMKNIMVIYLKVLILNLIVLFFIHR